MSKLPVISSDTLIKALKHFGYEIDHIKGSHIVLIREGEQRITVPARKTMPKGTLRAILRHCGISRESLLSALGKHKH